MKGMGANCNGIGNLQANVEMMSQYLPLSAFKSIYVVDLCGSLCEQARKKVIENKWTNVKVCQGDACTFMPPEGKATLVTFSYSLSSKCHDTTCLHPLFVLQLGLLCLCYLISGLCSSA